MGFKIQKTAIGLYLIKPDLYPDLRASLCRRLGAPNRFATHKRIPPGA